MCSWGFVTSEVNDRHDSFPSFSARAHQVCTSPQVSVHCVIVMLQKTSGFVSLGFSLCSIICRMKDNDAAGSGREGVVCAA